MRWGFLLLASTASAAPQHGTVIAKGARTIEVVNGVVFARDGKDTQTALIRVRGSETATATMKPFLGNKHVLDISVTREDSSNQRLDRVEQHFLLDTSREDRLVCEFAGDNKATGASVSTSVTIKITALHRDPLSFDVKSTMTTRSTQPQPAKTETTSSIEHYVVDTNPCTSFSMMQVE
ncbi:hypothetical protein BH11MYX1_BH11MYX1_25000 [soil metagenome]